MLVTTAAAGVAGAQETDDGGWTLEGCDWISAGEEPNETDQCLAQGDFPSFNINADWSIGNVSIADDDEEEPGDADVVFQRIDLGENLTINQDGDLVNVQGDGVTFEVFNDPNPACSFTWDETSDLDAAWINLTDDAQVTQLQNDTVPADADVWNRFVVETEERTVVIQGAVTWEEEQNALRVTGDTTCQIFQADDEIGQAVSEDRVHGTIFIDVQTNEVRRVNLHPNLTVSGVQVEQTNDQFTATAQVACEDCPGDNRTTLLFSINERLAQDEVNVTLDGETIEEADDVGALLDGTERGFAVQEQQERTRVLVAGTDLDQTAAFQISGTLAAADGNETDDDDLIGDDNETDENETDDDDLIGDDNDTDDVIDDNDTDDNDTDDNDTDDNDTDEPIEPDDEASAPAVVAVLAAVVVAATISVARRD